MKKYLSPGQVNRLQGLVKIAGFHSGTLAAKLELPRSTLISVLNGARCNPGARLKVAEFLGLPAADLFGDNGIGIEKAGCAPLSRPTAEE